jgi:hypothetical protein
MTDEQAVRPVGAEGSKISFAQHLIGNLSHVRDHTAQLNLFLGQQPDWAG